MGVCSIALFIMVRYKKLLTLLRLGEGCSMCPICFGLMESLNFAHLSHDKFHQMVKLIVVLHLSLII